MHLHRYRSVSILADQVLITCSGSTTHAKTVALGKSHCHSETWERPKSCCKLQTNLAISLLSVCFRELYWTGYCVSADTEQTLSTDQACFRPGSSTSSSSTCKQVLALTTFIENGFQKNFKTGAVFVDLTVACWMSLNHLQLNAAKTEFLWCSAAWRQNQLPTLPFRVCNDLVTPSVAVRDLGIYLDSDVRMDAKVSRTVSHCFGILRRLRSILRSLSSSVFQSLVASLVLSRLDYGNATLAGITSLQL